MPAYGSNFDQGGITLVGDGISVRGSSDDVSSDGLKLVKRDVEITQGTAAARGRIDGEFKWEGLLEAHGSVVGDCLGLVRHRRQEPDRRLLSEPVSVPSVETRTGDGSCPAPK